MTTPLVRMRARFGRGFRRTILSLCDARFVNISETNGEIQHWIAQKRLVNE